jgi:hypothetical protein
MRPRVVVLAVEKIWLLRLRVWRCWGLGLGVWRRERDMAPEAIVRPKEEMSALLKCDMGILR